MSKWISVKDALPEDRNLYLVRQLIGQREYFNIAYIFEDDWYEQRGGYLRLESITHWMPLPEPPEKEEE